MQMSLKQINAAIQKTEPLVELVKHGSGHKGYFYYCYDDKGSIFETETVPTPFLYMTKTSTWIADGLAFAEKVRKIVEER